MYYCGYNILPSETARLVSYAMSTHGSNQHFYCRLNHFCHYQTMGGLSGFPLHGSHDYTTGNPLCQKHGISWPETTGQTPLSCLADRSGSSHCMHFNILHHCATNSLKPLVASKPTCSIFLLSGELYPTSPLAAKACHDNGKGGKRMCK